MTYLLVDIGARGNDADQLILVVGKDSRNQGLGLQDEEGVRGE